VIGVDSQLPKRLESNDHIPPHVLHDCLIAVFHASYSLVLLEQLATIASLI